MFDSRAAKRKGVEIMVFRKIEERDVATYTEMATVFYSSPAVLHSILRQWNPGSYISPVCR